MEDTKNASGTTQTVYVRVTPKLDADVKKSLNELKDALTEVETKWDAFSNALHRINLDVTPL